MPLVLTQKDLMYFFSVTTVDADKITSDQTFSTLIKKILAMQSTSLSSHDLKPK